MRFTRLRGPGGVALVLGAALVMASIAIPALGGPSLKSLVKKEVRKQLRGKTGPPGATGVPGAPGAPGAQGPGATRLAFDQSNTDGQRRPIATVNELTVLGTCGGAGVGTVLDVEVRSSVGGATISAETLLSADGGNAVGTIPSQDVPVPTSGQQLILELATTGGTRSGFMQATFDTGSRTISLQLFAFARDDNGTCKVRGTAIPAT